MKRAPTNMFLANDISKGSSSDQRSNFWQAKYSLTIKPSAAAKLSPCVKWKIVSAMLARHLVIDHQQQPLIAIKYGNWQSTNILNANFICEIGCINKGDVQMDVVRVARVARVM
ncbi:hypothetical protein DINM_003738 [Dirofilaria immitis]|nr:hypothetical protein [Dirofilaria immitis]